MTMFLYCIAALVFPSSPMLSVAFGASGYVWNELHPADYEWLEVTIFWLAIVGIVAGFVTQG